MSRTWKKIGCSINRLRNTKIDTLMKMLEIYNSVFDQLKLEKMCYMKGK